MACAKLSSLFKEAKEKLSTPPDPPPRKKEHPIKKEVGRTDPEIKRGKLTKRRDSSLGLSTARKRNTILRIRMIHGTHALYLLVTFLSQLKRRTYSSWFLRLVPSSRYDNDQSRFLPVNFLLMSLGNSENS